MEDLYSKLKNITQQPGESEIDFDARQINTIGEYARGNIILVKRIMNGLPIGGRLHYTPAGIRVMYLEDELEKSDLSEMTKLIGYNMGLHSTVAGIAALLKGILFGGVGSAVAGCTTGNIYVATGAGAVGVAMPLVRNMMRMEGIYRQLHERATYLDRSIAKLGFDEVALARQADAIIAKAS